MASKSIVTKVIEPYAEALLDLAKAKSIISDVNQDMIVVSQFLSTSEDLQKFLSNPLVSGEAKKKVMEDVFEDQVNKDTLNFLMVLVNRGRIAFLGFIAERYLELSYKQASIEVANITSAVQLSSDQQKLLIEKLKKLTGAEQVKLRLKINPELIGGFVIEIGSQVIDTSISAQLRKVSSLLLASA